MKPPRAIKNGSRGGAVEVLLGLAWLSNIAFAADLSVTARIIDGDTILLTTPTVGWMSVSPRRAVVQ